MTKEKKDWGQIPALAGLEVDWKFEPDNPLGKRGLMRIIDDDLCAALGVKRIPVKVVAKNIDETGLLLDIAKGGFSVLLKMEPQVEQPLKVGFYLGTQKVISRGLVKNVGNQAGKYRVGIAFVDLDEKSQGVIADLVSSKVFKKSL